MLHLVLFANAGCIRASNCELRLSCKKSNEDDLEAKDGVGENYFEIGRKRVMGITVRRNITSLNAAELKSLRNGYGKMQAITDDRGFNHISGFHWDPFMYCHNESPYLTFLPWHRAYVYWFEQHLKDHDVNLFVPYWDWTSADSHQNGIPAAFSAAADDAGNHNPLYNSNISTRSTNRATRRNPAPPGDLSNSDYQATEDRIEDLLSNNRFEDFTADLEGAPHGSVHGWVGGDMGSVNHAGFDPLFYSHHCMVDRVWHQWQLQNGLDNIPKAILKKTLIPFGLTVEEVLDIKKLGYDYD